jgi:hypothetical protein
LGIFRGETVETLLDDMVAIEILDQIHNTITESLDDRLSLLRSRNELDHLLQSASAMLVQGDLDQLRCSVVN